jgi:hypothetical protein
MKCNKRLSVLIATPILLVLGMFFIAAGFLGPNAIDKALNKGIRELLIIDSPNAKGFGTFQNNTQSNSVPQYQNFYFFNITNPDDVKNGVAKPKLVQVGPYSYRKYENRFKFNFPDNGNQVQYKKWNFFVFDAEKSAGNPFTDRITTGNIPFQGNLFIS